MKINPKKSENHIFYDEFLENRGRSALKIIKNGLWSECDVEKKSKTLKKSTKNILKKIWKYCQKWAKISGFSSETNQFLNP